jgi:PAS domain S-box-containing protein
VTSRQDGAPRLWRSLAVALLIAAVLVAMALWFGSEYRHAARNTTEVQHSLRQEVAVEELFSTLKDMETGQRGYVITGDKAFLQPYVVARRELGQRIRELSRLVANEPVNRQKLSRIANLIGQKVAEMQRVMDIRDQEGLTPAAQTIGEGRGKRLMDSIRVEIADMQAQGRQQMDRLLARERNRTDLSEQIIWFAVALGSLAALIGAWLLWKSRKERHEASQRETDAAARRQAIFDNAFDATVLINPSGSMEVMNPAAERLFGYPSSGLLRRDISVIVDLAPGEGAFLTRLGLTSRGIAEPFRPLLHARRSDGSTVPVEVALGEMPLADGVHIVAAFRDVSEREKIERMKDQFLSTVSHELRTPLTSIVGSLGLLRGGAASELPAAVQRLIVIAESNANRLIRIVNDLLDVEKLEAGKMAFAFEPMDMRDAVGNAVDGMRGLAAAQDVTIAWQPDSLPTPVRGDSERLIQVVNNLLSNAVRFSPAGTTVTAAVSTVDGDKARIAISDQGPGIEGEIRERLFSRFAQGARPSEGVSAGTGLGLTIAREIVRNHGGTIWFEDAPGGGSTFAFTIPLWNAVAGQDELNGAPRLLLYCDQGEAAAIAAGFAARHIRTDMVTSAETALATLNERPYVALIIDLHHAERDSLSLLQSIRADRRYRGLPVIAIAGEDPPVGADQIAAFDIIAWLDKPLLTSTLDDAITAAIERAAVTMPVVLHIDDDSDTLEITAAALSGIARIVQATDLRSARQYLKDNRPDIMIIDIALPDGSGLDILADVAEIDGSPPPAIIYSAQDGEPTLARNVEAILTKSKKSLPNLVETIQSIVDRDHVDRGH